jgi:hypothetical protein
MASKTLALHPHDPPWERRLQAAGHGDLDYLLRLKTAFRHETSFREFSLRTSP